MENVTVKLTAYNMGDEATAADFDDWVTYVSDNIADVCKFSVDVEAFDFESGPAEDWITLGECTWEMRDEQTVTAREGLAVLWDRWCSQPHPAT